MFCLLSECDMEFPRDFSTLTYSRDAASEAMQKCESVKKIQRQERSEVVAIKECNAEEFSSRTFGCTFNVKSINSCNYFVEMKFDLWFFVKRWKLRRDVQKILFYFLRN